MVRSAALVLALLLAACTEPDRDPGGEVLARVDGAPIRAAELAAALRNGDLGEAPGAVRRRALEELIDRRLLLRAAADRDIRVTDAEVEHAMARLRDDYPEEQFERTLATEAIGPEALARDLRERLLLQRLFLREVVARVAVTDEEIDEWIAIHGEELRRPEQARAAQIVVATAEEAERIRERLRAGESFEDLARETSLSPDGKKGGDLGFFARDEMPPPFGEVCFGLKPGEVSEVVSSPYGFHVFKLLEKRPASTPAPEELRAEVVRRLRREKEAAAQQAFIARLREAAQIEIDEEALARLGERS